MSSSVEAILEKQRQQSDAEKMQEPVIPESDYYGAWTGAKSEVNERYIDFRSRTGHRISFDYPDRKFVGYDPDESSIHLDFGDALVSIHGRGIEQLYEWIVRRKIEWVREADDPEKDDSEDLSVFVTNISFIFDTEEQEGEVAADQ